MKELFIGISYAVANQPKIFKIGEEYPATVAEQKGNAFLLHFDNGGIGQISYQNFPRESLNLNINLTVKVIGFQKNGLMDVIPTETSIRILKIPFQEKEAEVVMNSPNGVILSLDNGQQIGIYAPGHPIPPRWQQLNPGQKVRCTAYRTGGDYYVNCITTIISDSGKATHNRDEKIYKEATAKGSATQRDIIKLGYLYTVIVQPSKIVLKDNGMEVRISNRTKLPVPERGNYPEITVRITFIPQSEHRLIQAYFEE